jgi:hypothetical protein
MGRDPKIRTEGAPQSYISTCLLLPASTVILPLATADRKGHCSAGQHSRSRRLEGNPRAFGTPNSRQNGLRGRKGQKTAEENPPARKCRVYLGMTTKRRVRRVSRSSFAVFARFPEMRQWPRQAPAPSPNPPRRNRTPERLPRGQVFCCSERIFGIILRSSSESKSAELLIAWTPVPVRALDDLPLDSFLPAKGCFRPLGASGHEMLEMRF